MVDNRKCAGKFLRKNYFQSECLYLWKYHSSMKVKYFSTCQTFTHLPQLSTRVDRCHFRLPNFPRVSGFKFFTQSTANTASVHPHPTPAFPMICKQLLSKGCATFLNGVWKRSNLAFMRLLQILEYIYFFCSTEKPISPFNQNLQNRYFC